MIWQVQVLGRMALQRGTQVITRFESQRVATLLAYLAMHPQRSHGREELIELLWPEEDPEKGRHRLRQAIYSLRKQLEPPGIPPNSVLVSDRLTLHLNLPTYTCDATEFERLLRQKRYSEARALYGGELLPGFYDDWILLERLRLSDLHERLPESEDAPLPGQAVAPTASPSPIVPSSRVVSLPTYLALCFGREVESRLLKERIASHRLVTLTGIGGIGKTRLAVEVAREMATRFETTAFVPLETCRSSHQILEHLPPALQLPPSSIAPLDQIAHALTGRKTLLILDNFEQLAEESGVLVEELLSRFPEITCLVTSRKLLGVPGECEFPLAPLPPPDTLENVEMSAREPAVALFLDRAQAVRPGFQITPGNCQAIHALCRALDGLPLALELAASRIRAYSPSEMLQQLETRFQWLARPAPGGQKDQRHRSLAATLEWSWRLLSPTQQRFLSALSVFRGGWTASLAAEVCDVPDARERLERLVMDSLVISETTAEDSTRFRLLETVRAFARDQLREPAAAEIALRHQRVFLSIAERSRGDDRSLLLAERDNVKAALESAIERQDTEAALALSVAIEEAWLPLAGPERAWEGLRQILQLPGGSLRLRIEALSLASYLTLLTRNRSVAGALAEEALQLAGDDPALRATALVASGRVGMVRSEEAMLRVRQQMDEAIALARSPGESRTLGGAYRLLGIVHTRQGEFDRAEKSLRSALDCFALAGDRQGTLATLDSLANNAVQQWQLEIALERYRQIETLAAEIHDVVLGAKVTQNMATVYARQQRWEEALRMGQRCVRLNHALGNAFIVAYALWNLTEPLAFLGKERESAQIMGFIERYWVARYDPLDPEEEGYVAMIRERASAAIGEAETARLWREGAQMTLHAAIDRALSL